MHSCRTGVARRPFAEVEAEAEGGFLDTQLARLGCDEHARQLVVTLEFRAGGGCGREARFSGGVYSGVVRYYRRWRGRFFFVLVAGVEGGWASVEKSN